MTDKDLRHLSRAELLDILYEQQKRYEDSLAENQARGSSWRTGRFALRPPGSIAEAAIQVNGVFEAAQAAADQYLASVKVQQPTWCRRRTRHSGSARRSYRTQNSRLIRSYRTRRRKQTGF